MATGLLRLRPEQSNLYCSWRDNKLAEYNGKCRKFYSAVVNVSWATFTIWVRMSSRIRRLFYSFPSDVIASVSWRAFARTIYNRLQLNPPEVGVQFYYRTLWFDWYVLWSTTLWIRQHIHRSSPITDHRHCFSNSTETIKIPVKGFFVKKSAHSKLQNTISRMLIEFTYASA